MSQACRCSMSRGCHLLVGLIFSIGAGSLGAAGLEHTLKIVVQAGYLPGAPVLVRVELRGAGGRPDRELWNAEATLSEDSDSVTLSTNRVLLRNGLGTALVTPTGSGDFTLRVELGGLQVMRPVQDRSSESVTAVSGTLPGTETTWAGVILITN